MSGIEERLLSLIDEQDSVTHYNINGGSLMLRHHQERRDALRSEIAADWNEAFSLLEDLLGMIDVESPTTDRAWALIDRVKGES